MTSVHHYQAMRRGTRALVVAALLAASVIVAGCGGGDSTSPKGDAKGDRPKLEGGFSGTVTTRETNAPGKQPATPEAIAVLHTCEDDACDIVWQRTLGHEAGAGMTVRLGRSGDDTWEGDGERTGTCSDDAELTATVALTHAWTLDGKQLAGTRSNEVRGCPKQYPSETTYELEADPKATAPYLDPSETDELKAAISEFDEGYAAYLEVEPTCRTQAGTAGTADEGRDCYQRAFTSWKDGIGGIPEALDAVDGAEGDCDAALAAAGPLVQAESTTLDRAIKLFAKESATVAREAPDLIGAAYDQAHRAHVAVAEVAYFCVSPTDVDGLGTDGTLPALDRDQVLVPLGDDDSGD